MRWPLRKADNLKPHCHIGSAATSIVDHSILLLDPHSGLSAFGLKSRYPAAGLLPAPYLRTAQSAFSGSQIVIARLISFQVFRRIGGFDASKYVAGFIAYINDRLPSTYPRHRVVSLDDTGNTQVWSNRNHQNDGVCIGSNFSLSAYRIFSRFSLMPQQWLQSYRFQPGHQPEFVMAEQRLGITGQAVSPDSSFPHCQG
jgi:hypothetical protein